MKKCLFAIGLMVSLIIALPACRNSPEDIGVDAPPDAVPEIAGSYSVNGIDPLGTDYGGNLTITPGETTDTYNLQWIVTGSIQEGNGRLNGNTLLVEWRTVASAAGQSQGQATYTVTVKGILYGTRSVNGRTSQGTETAYPN